MNIWSRLKQLFEGREEGGQVNESGFTIVGETAEAMQNAALRRGMSVEALIMAIVESTVQYDQWQAHLWACWDQLSPRLQETALLVREGYSQREIAKRLVVSRSTVKWRVTKIMKVFGASNAYELQTMLREMGVE